jgi:spore coat protein U-like protein
MKQLSLSAILCFFCFVAAAFAQTCSVTATAVAFAIYNPNSSSPTDTTGTVSVSCSSSAPLLVSYSIALSAGGGGSVATRSMSGGTSTRLSYQIYADLLRTQIWGDGSSGSATVSDGYPLLSATPVTRQYTAFARAPARQVLQPSNYSDFVMVLLTY